MQPARSCFPGCGLFRNRVNRRLKNRAAGQLGRVAGLPAGAAGHSGRERRHADLQGSRRRGDVSVARRVPRRALQQPARFCRSLTRHRRGRARGGGKVLRGRAHPAQPRRRQGRLPAPCRRFRHHAAGIQGRLQEIGRRRLGLRLGARRVRRPRPADRAHPGYPRVPVLIEHGLCHVFEPGAGRGRGDL